MEEEDTTALIMASLSSLPPLHLSRLTQTLHNLSHRHSTRLSALLSSPVLFSLTLRRLLSLPLPLKTTLVARHLVAFLLPLARCQGHTSHSSYTSSFSSSAATSLRDLDAVLLLLLLCETHRTNPDALEAPLDRWRHVLKRLYSDALLESVTGMWAHGSGVLIPYIETVARCRRFIAAMGHAIGKEEREVAASPAAMVALPAVESPAGAGECAICKEEMREGRRVCEMPCKHLFHWMCILPWLSKRNTCPCCRLQLPTDDVFGEVDRLWSVAVRGGDGEAWRNRAGG